MKVSRTGNGKGWKEPQKLAGSTPMIPIEKHERQENVALIYIELSTPNNTHLLTLNR
jgi:hypothetical protein